MKCRSKVNYLKKEIVKWIKNNRWEFFSLIFILVIASVLRLYKIGDYMTFLGDEGRDAIIVRRLLVNFDPILIGPRTSIGDMYLGPLYYYLIAPSLLLAGFSPVGPSIFVALIGVATVFAVWYVTRKWFNSKAASLMAALLYGVSPVVIIYSSSSWNPNVMPFFALVCIFSIWRLWGDKLDEKKESIARYKWLIVLAVSFAFVLQSHYLGLLLLPTLILFYTLHLYELKRAGRWKLVIDQLKSYSFISIGMFLLLMSPLVIFDARHGWNNFASMKKFFLERQTTVSARPWTGIPKIPQIAQQVVERLVAGTNSKYSDFVWIVLFILVVIYLTGVFYKAVVKRKLNKEIKAVYLLFSWLGFAFLGLALYKQHVYDHYFGFFFPAVYILLGAVIGWILSKKNIIFNILTFLFVFFLTIINLQNSPLKSPPNKQMERARVVADKIAQESGNKKFNLAVIAERNYEDGYQYFLEKAGQPVVDIDPLDYEMTLADQLFVVCELPQEECDPTHSDKAEVANFGWSEIEDQWDVAGVVVYKLIHSQE